MTQRVAICFIALGVLLGFTGGAKAVPITWEFEGIVRSAKMGDASGLAGSLGVSVGASASGRITYESTTPPISPGGGAYDALVAFEVTIGSYGTTLVDSALNVVLVTPRGGNVFDQFIVSGSANPDSLFPSGAAPWLALLADSPGVIVGTALPSEPPLLALLRPFALEDWQTIGYGTGLTLFRGPNNDDGVLIEFTRLELVPEPEAFLLLGLASLAIGLQRRERC